MINTLIVDEVTQSADSLKQQLKTHCPQICVNGVACSKEEAGRLIMGEYPELVFMEATMLSGFTIGLLKQPFHTFEVILTSSQLRDREKPLPFWAGSYLYKPFGIDELVMAVHLSTRIR